MPKGRPRQEVIQEWLVKHPRFHFHFTPTSASWLNMVERWFAELTNRQIKRGSPQSVQELGKAITTYIEYNNTHPKLFVWVKTAEQIIESIGRFCSSICESKYWLPGQ